jgi:hypothetical protein
MQTVPAQRTGYEGNLANPSERPRIATAEPQASHDPGTARRHDTPTYGTPIVDHWAGTAGLARCPLPLDGDRHLEGRPAAAG